MHITNIYDQKNVSCIKIQNIPIAIVYVVVEVSNCKTLNKLYQVVNRIIH